MSSAMFPTFPGTKLTVTRTPTWSTKILKSASGREQRVAWYSSPIYEYQLEIEVLRQGNIAARSWTEAQTLVDFYNARSGAFDTFLFVDPFDGATKSVRFKEDKLDMQRVLAGVWDAKKVYLVEVKA